MKGEVGIRSGVLATSVVRTCARSAARNRISLMTCGQASASTQIRTQRLPNVMEDESPGQILGHAIVEGTEMLNLTPSGPGGAQLVAGRNTAVLLITDDDLGGIV